MPDYDAGRVFLRIVPSFENVQRLIGAQARRDGEQYGREWQRAFDREVDRSKASPGPSRSDSAKQGSDAGGAFGDAFKRRVEAAMRSLPPVKIGPVETGSTEAKLRDLRLQLERMSRQQIGVDIDAGTAVAELQRIDAELDQLGRNSADIQVRADTAAARAQLAAVHAQVNDLDGDNVNVRVDVDAAGAFATLNSFSGRLLLLGTAGAALAPAIVPAAAAAGVALAGIGTGAIAGLAGIGTLAIGFQGISDAVKALGEVDANAADDAIRNANRRNTAAQSIASAQRQVENAERSLANTRAGIADQAVNAAERVADAQEAVAEAVEDANRQAEVSTRRVADAQTALERTVRSVAERVEEATERVADAQRGVADAVEDANRQAALSTRRVADAQRDLAEAVEDANRQAADSAERVADAQRDLADAVESSSRAVEASARRIADAERGLADAQLRSVEAQNDVTAARRDAQETLEDLEFASRSATLSEEAAVLALERAQLRLARLQGDDTVLRLSEEQLERLRAVAQEVGPEAERARRLLEAATAAPANPLDLREADLAVRQASLRLDEARERNQDVQQEAAKAQRAGVDGAEAVLSAEERLVRTRRDEADANQRLRDSETELARTRVDGARQVEEAQGRVADAVEAQIEQQERSAERIEQATRQVTDAAEAQIEQQERSAERVEQANRRAADAQRDLGRAQRDGAEQVEAAQRRVTDAVEAQSLQQERSADRIVDAQERVADAVRSQEEQQRQAAFALAGAIASVEGANAALAAALVETGDIGSASINKLEDAMSALSPAGQEFARFIYGLKPLWDELKASVEGALLPGFQAGLEAILPHAPAIIDFFTELAGVMGTLAREAGAALAGPAWRPFFQTLAEISPGLLLAMGRAMGDLALAFANLFVAFAPLSVAFVNGLARMTRAFADWTSTLSENEDFQRFLDYLIDSGPQIMDFLDSLIDAFVQIVRSMAPFGPIILKIVTALLDFVAALPPEVLSAMVLGILGLVVVFGYLVPVVIAVGAALTFLGGPIAAAIVVVIALGAAFTSLIAHAGGFQQFTERVERGARRFGDALVDAFDRVMRGVERFGEIWDNFWQRVQRGAERVVGWFQWLYDQLVGNSIIPDLINEIVAWFAGLPGKIVDALTAGAAALLTAGRWVVNQIWDGIKEVWNSAAGVAGFFAVLPATILGWIITAAQKFFDIGAKVASTIKDGVVSFINNPEEGLKFFFLDLPNKFMAWVVERAQSFFDIGAKIASTIKDGIMELAKFKLTDALPSWVPGVGDPSDGSGSGGGSFPRASGGGGGGGSSWGPIAGAFNSVVEGREGSSGSKPPRTSQRGHGFGPGYVGPWVQAAHARFGGRVTTRYRTPEYNASIGGAKNSRHLDWRNPAHDYVAPNMRAAFEWLVGRFGHLMRGTIYGNTRVARGVRYPYRRNDHWDHIHIAHEGGWVSPLWGTGPGLKSDERPAILQVGEYVVPKNLARMFMGQAKASYPPLLFDQGGRLQPGLSTVMNATGRPELVLTPSQEGALAAELRRRADVAAIVNGDVLIDGHKAGVIVAPGVMEAAGMNRMRQMGRVV